MYNAFRDRDRKRKLAIDDKVENKRTRLKKKAKQAQVDQARLTTRLTRKRKRPSKPIAATTTAASSTAPSATADRQEYFAGLQTLLSNSSTYAAMKLAITDPLPYPLQVTPCSSSLLTSSLQLCRHVTDEDTSSLGPVRAEGLLFTGSEARHTEMRARIVLDTKSFKFSVWVIYDPPPSSKIRELLQSSTLNPKTYFMTVILGDFNINYDDAKQSESLRMLLRVFNLIQHMDVATQRSAHVLDLMITHADDDCCHL